MVARLAINRAKGMEGDASAFSESHMAVFGLHVSDFTEDDNLDASPSVNCDNVVELAQSFLASDGALDVIVRSAARTRRERDLVMMLASKKIDYLNGRPVLRVPPDMTWRQVALYFFTHVLQRLFDQRGMARLEAAEAAEAASKIELCKAQKPKVKKIKKRKPAPSLSCQAPSPVPSPLPQLPERYAWISRNTFVDWEDASDAAPCARARSWGR